MSPRMLLIIFLGFVVLAKSEVVRYLEVSESAPIGTRIGFIDAESPPYLIVPVPGSAVESDLIVDPATGEIKTRVKLDREIRPVYSLVALPHNIRVVVKVLDENDNAPTFPVKHVEVEFPENSPRDSRRALPPAKDPDLDKFSTQRYEIVSGNYADNFKLAFIRGRDGVLYLDLMNNIILDRETKASYHLVIEALDGGTPPLSSQLYVNVTIQDVNDNPPIFQQSRYNVSVAENTTIGTAIISVNASDADIGDNGRIDYFINRRQSDREEIFRINTETGVVYLNKALDFEQSERHELVIVARDRGAQPLEASTFISVFVKDINDNQPAIMVTYLSIDSTPKISEAAQPGEFVARISISDPDFRTEYSNTSVNLSGGDGYFGLTTRDNVVYLVLNDKPLDREEREIYELSLDATDAGTPPLRAVSNIRLMVTDVNDNAPRFAQDRYETHLSEISQPGSLLVTVRAEDADKGDNAGIKYSIRNTTLFAIDEDTGTISTATHIDCKADSMPVFTVIATDLGEPPLSSSATVQVIVHSVNDNEPIFEKPLYNVTVPEDLPPGRCFIEVKATDSDCGINSVVNYSFISNNAALDKFFIRKDSGAICIKALLDREVDSFYELIIVATDRGGLSSSSVLQITVSDVNDNQPVFKPQLYNITLELDNVNDGPIVKVFASDADDGFFKQVFYAIAAGNKEEIFKIDEKNGTISVVKARQLKRSNTHVLKVSATDIGGLKSIVDAYVYIKITSPGRVDPSCEKSKYTIKIKENATQNTYLGSIKESRLSSSTGSSEFHLVNEESDIYLDAHSGSIHTRQHLDRENRDLYLLSVRVQNGNSVGYCQVEIVVEDVNDNAPTFYSSYSQVSVTETFPLHNIIYIARATDRDITPDAALRYTIIKNSRDLFNINSFSGEVYLSQYLDYESQKRHQVLVNAFDGSNFSNNFTLNIQVQDMNDNSPIFEKSEYHVEVSESAKVNSQIFTLKAVDFDSGNNARIVYQIENSDLFFIQPHTGSIMLIGKLDREIVDRYSLKVIAMDNGSPQKSASVSVTITVLDDNDNEPFFEKNLYEFEIQENLSAGAVVGAITAADVDTGKNAQLKYAVLQANTSFIINPDTGVITTREPLDRELKATYELFFEARDQGTPSKAARALVRIAVKDINDNSPQIVDPQGDLVSVREAQPPGINVTRVKAVDYDLGENSSITYSILQDEGSDGYSVFSIDSKSGTIKTKSTLDHEERNVYNLLVKASDGGRPSKYSIKTLRVEVLALSDSQPTFTSRSLSFEVLEDAPIAHTVGSLSEAGLGEHVVYTLESIQPPSDYSPLDVDYVSGQIVVAGTLDREKVSEYNLNIKALDSTSHSNPQMTSIFVKITIKDRNDNPPHWTKDPTDIKVRESTPVGSIIGNLSAIDMDYGSNSDLRYSLMNEDRTNPKFAIDSLTGALSIVQSLDYEERSEHTLIIRAEDNSVNSKKLASTATVRVFVIDENDNHPVFVSPESSKLYITPNIIPGDVVMRVIAVDKDSGEFGRVSYAMNSDERRIFSIDSETGLLRLVQSVNRESELEIIASDHGIPPLKTTLKMTVAPSLEQMDEEFHLLTPHSIIKIKENQLVGSEVLRIGDVNATHQGNVLFTIPEGETSDKFRISSDGIVSLKKVLDREEKSHYSVPIFAQTDKIFESTTLEIVVLDENDNSPKFEPGSCYTIIVPENYNTPFIHTVSATDDDIGINGEIIYSIKSGNMGSKLKLDPNTGVLSTTTSLDRENVSKYILTISAKDKGYPSRETFCNMTVLVLDVNDNAPMFLQNEYGNPRTLSKTDQEENDFENSDSGSFMQGKYSTVIPEDAAVDSSIMFVQALDQDEGINGKVTYSIADEKTWLFRIDNLTGVITTTGSLDREQQDFFSFLVVATDSGKYKAQQTSVVVEIFISDINDNYPTFSEYPYKAVVPVNTQAGQNVLQVIAEDLDAGQNSELMYTLVNNTHDSKFSINPTSGIVSLTPGTSLSSLNGRIHRLEVLATDKGYPPLSTSSLIEFQIGELSNIGPSLHFQNESYTIVIEENLKVDTEIIQVSAVRSDGRRQHIIYSIFPNNNLNTFTIDKESGVIRVANSSNLDAELWVDSKKENIDSFDSRENNFFKDSDRELAQNKPLTKKGFELIIVAQTTESDPLVAYAKVNIRISDINDNAPIFLQSQYSATALEGNAKGDFVVQLSANDLDEGLNSKILYHIVDGNPDNAFTINPPYSGTVRTNIVLDREIRDQYRLTIIATDQGHPQLTGTTTLSVRVIDINDNQPTFPEQRTIKVPEDTPMGTVLTTITANDVDSSPALTYRFDDFTYKNKFSIDKFSGQITLVSKLDAEDLNEYILKIVASDEIHEVVTELTVKVTDVNDNKPRFEQTIYVTTLREESMEIAEVITVNAVDDDISEDNRKINYNFLKSRKEFTINPMTGKISVNRTLLSASLPRIITLSVVAKDSGKPSLFTTCAVVIHLNTFRDNSSLHEHKISVKESTIRGTTLLKLSDVGILGNAIVIGNGNTTFEVYQGKLILIENLDRESHPRYVLRLGAKRDNAAVGLLVDIYSVLVIINIEDDNDNYPRFNEDMRRVTIREDAPLNYSILSVQAKDDDLPESLASMVVYDITSGNDAGLFRMDKFSGTIFVNSSLDYDDGPEKYHLVTRACDSDPTRPLCALDYLEVFLEDVNDNSPRFPVSEYFKFVNENAPIGTVVSVLRAFDHDRGIYGELNYSIAAWTTDRLSNSDNGHMFFAIDPKTGSVTTRAVFDYEKRNNYAFTLNAVDPDGKSASANVHVEVNSQDEFYPQFTQRMYNFKIRINNLISAGTIVGYVTATDEDKGVDGIVVYQLKTQNSFFKVNRTSGALIVKKHLKQINQDFYEPFKLIVTASSGRQNSLSNITVIQISFVNLTDNSTIDVPFNVRNDVPVTSYSSISNWTLSLFISLLLLLVTLSSVFLYFHIKNCRHEKSGSKGSFEGNRTAPPNSYINSNTIDNLTIRNINLRGNVENVNMNDRSIRGSSCAFSKYDEIPPYGTSSQFRLQTGSELSGSDQSVSSGHGSAEDDGEDEEIRMINKAQHIADSASDLSVHNTQEYLARLGIVDSLNNPNKQLPEALTFDNLHLFEDEVVTDADIATLIYGKIGNLSRPTSSVGIPGNSSVNGSYTSIVHSEEELTGSYDWDYLLDWGPQYQPLAHVFSEIAELKDDLTSVEERPSINPMESMRKKSSSSLSTVAPKFVNSSVRGIVPRSPISHDSSVFPSAALSPSFVPSLSPLATRSPNISPLIPAGTSKSHCSSQGLMMNEEELRF